MSRQHILIIEDAPRPVDGSREDLADRARVAELYQALERLGHGILPGSPYLVDELRARATFANLVADGATVRDALEQIYRSKP